MAARVARPISEADVQQGTWDGFDEEKADAARDLIRLFARARNCVADVRVAGTLGEPQSRVMLTDMRGRLAEAILDDCVLFDEPTILTLFEFLSAWRGAAGERELPDNVSPSAVLEISYRQAVQSLGSHLSPTMPVD